MYASPDAISEWAEWAVEGGDDRPLILCEYSHSMGNSNGGLDAYWEAFWKHDQLGGGFVWDWRDQGLREVTDDGTEWFAYGGHYGDVPNDANFCINGLVDPDLEPHLGLAELKWLARPVTATVVDTDGALIRIRLHNRRSHTDTSDLEFRWQLVADGTVLADGSIDAQPIAAGTKCDVELSIGDTFAAAELDDLFDHDQFDHVVLTIEVQLAADSMWAEAGHSVGHDQYRWPAAVTAPSHLMTMSSDAAQSAASIVQQATPTVWRAPTDNDGVAQGWMSEVSGIRPQWNAWELYDADLSSFHHRTIDEHVVNGREVVLSIVDVFELPTQWDDLPRIGVMFDLPASFDSIRWSGLGPGESYSDRCSAAKQGTWESTVAAQYHRFVVPQEHGAHFDTTWFELVDRHDGTVVRIEAAEPFSFSARDHTDAALTAATTLAELERASHVEVHVDVAMRGLGTAACGPDVRHTCKVRGGRHELRWWLSVRPV